MAQYTVEVREIVKSGFPLFNFNYPIWENNYRVVLEEKIINRYYTREIGFETVGLFQHFLKDRLVAIMPKYNEMYLAKVEYLKQHAYTNKDIKTTRLQITDSESEQNANNQSTGSSKNVRHDTPMNNLGANDEGYATEINRDTDTGTTTGKVDGTAKTVDDVLEHIIGFDGMKYAYEVYQGVRDNIINIDELIIDELKDLFMGVY